MRLLAFADQAPPLEAAELVAGNRPDAVVTLTLMRGDDERRIRVTLEERPEERGG